MLRIKVGRKRFQDPIELKYRRVFKLLLRSSPSACFYLVYIVYLGSDDEERAIFFSRDRAEIPVEYIFTPNAHLNDLCHGV